MLWLAVQRKIENVLLNFTASIEVTFSDG